MYMTDHHTINSSGSVILIFFLLLVCLPFNSGPTLKYALAVLFTAASVYDVCRDTQRCRSIFHRLLKTPVAWTAGLFALALLISVFTSMDPMYSARKFMEEAVLNLGLYFSFAAYCATTDRDTGWMDIIAWAVILFLVFYLGLMMQWAFSHAGRLLLEIPGKCDFPQSTFWDRIFGYGNCNQLVHGIKHTSFFLLLGISVSFAGIIWKHRPWLHVPACVLSFLSLVTTTRRAAIIAAILGAGMAVFLRKEARRHVLVAIILCVALLSTLLATGKGRYFLRENWDLILQGEIEKAKEQEGSIPIRMLCITEFSKEIMKHPFRGAGLGRRNIRRRFPGPCKDLGISHPHNILLSLACETGIQGAIALILLVIAQARMFIQAFRRTGSDQTKMLMAAALIYMCTFWLAQLATYSFHHGTSTLYWLFMAIPTGHAVSCRASEIS